MTAITHDQIPPFVETPRVIVPGHVWVGAKETACALGLGRFESDAMAPDRYSALGVKSVLCPAFNVRLIYRERFPFLVLNIDDYDDVRQELFDLACAFHRAHGPTLVHCNGGRNRSVAFALALADACHGVPLERGAEVLNLPTNELWASLVAWRKARTR